jgi:beta-glucosidase
LDASKLGSIAILGPQAARVSLGDYVFENAQNQSISPLAGIQAFLSSKKSSTTVNYAEGAKLWSSDESMIPEAVEAAKKSDVAVVFVGTWTLDQQHLWLPNTDALGNPVSNATTGEHNDISDLGLVGASRKLVQAVVATGKPTVVVFVSGKPVAEPWIAARKSPSLFLCLVRRAHITI